MAQAKRKKRHKCKNHPRRIARGRCPTCRQWICRECAVLHEGKFYCKDTCSPIQEDAASRAPDRKPKSDVKSDEKRKATKKPSVTAKMRLRTKPDTGASAVKRQKPAQRKKVREEQKKPKEKKRILPAAVKTIIFWASLTVGFGGLAFGLYELKRSRELQDRVLMYKESRSRLVKLVKKRNAYIRKLKEERRTAEPEEEKEDKGTKPGRVTVSPSYRQREYRYIPGKLPVTFDNGASDKKLIALTFDGGDLANAAEAILDTLKSRDVLATMFLTGTFIRKNEGLVRMIVADGHEVGNHTTTHPHLTSWVETRSQTTLAGITAEVIHKELVTANTCFNKVTGSDMLPIWRAPYGERNREICLWAQQSGYLHIGWKQARYWRQNFDTNDWVPDPETPGYYTPEETLKKFNALADLQPFGMNGAIILMHLGTQRKQKDQQIHLILGLLIDQLREKGYAFVPISVLLKESGVDISLLDQS